MKKFSFFVFLFVCLFSNIFIHATFSQIISTEPLNQSAKKSIRSNQQKTFEPDLTSRNRDLATDKFTLTDKGFLDPTIQAIEAAIKPDEYFVGPGDYFYVNVSGESEIVIPSQVTPEGKLIIETIGTLDVSGKNLLQVKDLVEQAGKKKYKIKTVQANLVQLRAFRVHVVGEVERPGTYLAQAVDRASLLIERAGSPTDWANERGIEIRHCDGTVDFLDLSLFQNMGQLSQNIYLTNGDVIYVPPIDLSANSVTLEGDVEKPGIHSINENELLSEFLTRVNVLNRDSDPKHINIIRNTDEGESSLIRINLSSLEIEDKKNVLNDIKLQHGDKISIPTLNNLVYVHGAVRNPGGYQYIAGSTAKDYAGFAGGTELMGNIKGIKVYHHRTNSIEKGPNALVEQGDSIIIPLNFRKRFAEYLGIVTGMATLLFAYLAAQK